MADDTLLDAAGRIADGEQVDWASITLDAADPTIDRAVADELAVLAQIAAGHRQLHQLLPVASDTPANLMPDRARWGHLDLLNIVGRGSYGTVYRAWDTRLERLVALKLFHGASGSRCGDAGRPHARARAARERRHGLRRRHDRRRGGPVDGAGARRARSSRS